MIIRLKRDAAPEQIQEIVRRTEGEGLRAEVSTVAGTTWIGVVGDTRALDENLFRELEYVETVTRISRPYLLVSREASPETRRIRVGDVVFGDGQPVIVAGPCAVEGRESLLTLAAAVKDAGARMLRGGAYKPRTSPYAFQGNGSQALEWLAAARARTGMPVVTEATGTHHHPLPGGGTEARPVLEQVVRRRMWCRSAPAT